MVVPNLAITVLPLLPVVNQITTSMESVPPDSKDVTWAVIFCTRRQPEIKFKHTKLESAIRSSVTMPSINRTFIIAEIVHLTLLRAEILILLHSAKSKRKPTTELWTIANLWVSKQHHQNEFVSNREKEMTTMHAKVIHFLITSWIKARLQWLKTYLQEGT